MSLLHLFLRRRVRQGLPEASFNGVIAKTSSIAAVGVATVQATDTIQIVKTASVSATAVKVTTNKVLVAKTSSTSANGIKALTNAVMPIKTPSVTATGVVAGHELQVQVGTPLITATSVKTIAGVILAVKTPSVTATGVLSGHELQVQVGASSVTAAGVKASASARLPVKTSSITAEAVPLVTTGRVIAYTPSIGVTGVKLPIPVRLAVKTPSVSAVGIKTSATAHLPVKTSSVFAINVKTTLALRRPIYTSSITAAGVKSTLVVKASAKTSSVNATGVKSSLEFRLNVGTPSLGVAGVKGTLILKTLVKTSSVEALGVFTPQTARVIAKTPSINVSGVLSYVFDSLPGAGSSGDLRMYYTGSSTYLADYRQYVSLGGAISSNEVGSNRPAASTLQGVTIIDAYGNDIGVNGYWSPVTLTFLSGSPNRYQWGDSIPVETPSAGFYTLGDTDTGQAYVYINGTFPGASTSEEVQVARGRHTLFPVQSPYDSHFGKTDYRCFYLKNNSLSDALAVTIWVDAQPAVGTQLAIGADPAGLGDGLSVGVATSIARDDIPPTNVIFSLPTEGSPLVLGSIPQNKSRAIWVRRTLTPPIAPLTFFNESSIKIGAFL